MLETDNCFDCENNLHAFKYSKKQGYFLLLFLSEMGKTTWRKINLSTNSLNELKKSVNLTKARQ